MNNWTIETPAGNYIYGIKNDEYGNNANTPVNQTIASLSTRRGIRNGIFVVDVELTAAGFDGTENVDWMNVFYIY